MTQYVPEVMISVDQINDRVKSLAQMITKDYSNEDIIVVCILKGAFVFCSDLIKSINLPLKVEFMSCSSYGDAMESSGNVKIELDLTGSIKDKNVLIVEDIIDSGLTMKTLKDLLMARQPKSLKIASLLYKPDKIRFPVDIDYLAFEIEDKFVVGYGLDYAGRYRELPYIGILNAGH